MRYIIALFFLFSSFFTFSQNSIYNSLGKNRIQYNSLNWEVMYSNNFEFYYNSNALNVVEIAALHLETTFSEYTNNIGHQPFQKTKVFIYNSEEDKKQSNIGINETNKL